MQLTHQNSPFKTETFPIVLVCDNILSAANIGGLFRIADAFGVEKLVFCGSDFKLGKRFKRSSRSTEKYVTYEIVEDINQVINDLKKQNFNCLALEISSNSKPINAYRVQNKAPIALIIGNENFGVSKNVLDTIDHSLHITMYGKNSSMNVVQATGIALYELTNQLNS